MITYTLEKNSGEFCCGFLHKSMATTSPSHCVVQLWLTPRKICRGLALLPSNPFSSSSVCVSWPNPSQGMLTGHGFTWWKKNQQPKAMLGCGPWQEGNEEVETLVSQGTDKLTLSLAREGSLDSEFPKRLEMLAQEACESVHPLQRSQKNKSSVQRNQNLDAAWMYTVSLFNEGFVAGRESDFCKLSIKRIRSPPKVGFKPSPK